MDRPDLFGVGLNHMNQRLIFQQLPITRLFKAYSYFYSLDIT